MIVVDKLTVQQVHVLVAQGSCTICLVRRNTTVHIDRQMYWLIVFSDKLLKFVCKAVDEK